MKADQKISDSDRALIFLFLLQKGMPPWAEKGAAGQAKVLAMLCDWKLDRAAAAFEQAIRAGFAELPPLGTYAEPAPAALPLTRMELDQMKCGLCGGVKCKHNPVMYLRSVCHQGSPSIAIYNQSDGILTKPGTPANDQFEMAMVKWEHMQFAIVVIPRTCKGQAEWIMKQLGLRAADGVPTVFEKSGRKDFPIQLPNVFTIENVPGHFAYKNSPDLSKSAEDFEDEACQREFESHQPAGARV